MEQASLCFERNSDGCTSSVRFFFSNQQNNTIIGNLNERTFEQATEGCGDLRHATLSNDVKRCVQKYEHQQIKNAMTILN